MNSKVVTDEVWNIAAGNQTSSRYDQVQSMIIHMRGLIVVLDKVVWNQYGREALCEGGIPVVNVDIEIAQY